jgi:hypothetical protein
MELFLGNKIKMKFDRNCKLHLCCSKGEDTRFNTHKIKIHGPLGCELVATDGRMLAVVPVEIETGDEGDFLEVDTYKAALAAKLQYKGKATIRPAGDTVKVGPLEEMTFRQEPCDGRYPVIENLVPNKSDAKSSVLINPRMLWELCQAIGQGTWSAKQTVELHFFGAGKPLLVTTDAEDGGASPYGVIMPLVKVAK